MYTYIYIYIYIYIYVAHVPACALPRRSVFPQTPVSLILAPWLMTRLFDGIGYSTTKDNVMRCHTMPYDMT